MMKLTKKKAIELHRELWDWLYHNPEKAKGDWPRWEELEKVMAQCFLCEYANRKCNLTLFQCECCPLAWPRFDLWSRKGVFCYQKDTPFDKWAKAKSPRIKKKYAKIIRDLPERK